MAKKAVIKYMEFMLLVFTTAISIFLLMGIIGGYINPIGNLSYALMVYSMPIFSAIGFVLFLYWAFYKRSWVLSAIPGVPVLISLYFLAGYYQLASRNTDAMNRSGVMVASYNIGRFGGEGLANLISQDILAVMERHEVDILCLQEYKDDGGNQRIRDIYKKVFPYIAFGKDDMVIFSKYPIRNSKTIQFEETNNSAMSADINIDGKVIRVYNVHMQSTGINASLYGMAKRVTSGESLEKNLILKTLFGSYTSGLMIRAGQAHVVANHMNMNRDVRSIILCGDFNDVPGSYVYNTLKNGMTDGFRECGSGWGATYRGSSFRKARIDYIFHTDDMNGITLYTEDLTYSDHIPVFSKIKIN